MFLPLGMWLAMVSGTRGAKPGVPRHLAIKEEEMATEAGLYTQDKDPTTGLTRNQRTVLDGMTKEGKSQLQVSQDMGISRQRVNQIVRDLKAKGYKL